MLKSCCKRTSGDNVLRRVAFCCVAGGSGKENQKAAISRRLGRFGRSACLDCHQIGIPTKTRSIRLKINSSFFLSSRLASSIRSRYRTILSFSVMAASPFLHLFHLSVDGAMVPTKKANPKRRCYCVPGFFCALRRSRNEVVHIISRQVIGAGNPANELQ